MLVNFEEPVVGELSFAAALDAGVAFGHQPYPAAEHGVEPAQGLECPGHGHGSEGVGFGAADEGGVVAAGV